MPKRTGKAHSPELRAAAIEHYRNGLSQHEIGGLLDITSQTVGRWVRAAGIPVAQMPGRHVTEDQRGTIALAYLAGATLNELATEHGLSTWSIRKCLNVHGIEARPRPAVHSAETRADVVQAYLDGGSMREVAEQFRVSRSSVRLWVRASGNETRPSNKDRLAVPESVIDAYRSGESIASLNRRTGYAKSTIRERIVEAGIPIREPHWRGDDYHMPRIDPPGTTA